MEGAIYVGTNTETEKGLARIVTETVDGKPLPARKWLYGTKNPVVLSAAVSSKGRVYCVDGARGDAGRSLHCIDAEAGTAKWKRPVEDGAEGTVLVTEDVIFAADRKDSVVCLDRNDEGEPSERWRADVGGCAAAPFVFGDIVVMATSSKPRLTALDMETGKVLWQTGLPSAPQTDVIVARYEEEIPRPVDEDAEPSEEEDEGPKTLVVIDDVVLLGMAEGLTGYSLLNGEKVWSVPCGRVRHLLRATDRLAACVTASSELVMVDYAKGKEVKRVPNVVPTVAPMRAGDALLFYERPSPKKESIQRWDLTNIRKEPKQWARTSWLGKIRTPLVGVESHVYFTTDKRGLVCLKPSRR
jgi:outer membrane protein assembly factor BamB